MAHVAALRAFGDDLPVGVVVFVEGEEEFGSDSLEALLREHRDELAADVIVIADSGNWDVGAARADHLAARHRQLLRRGRARSTTPCTAACSAAPVPDALTTLCRLLATPARRRRRRGGRRAGRAARPRRWTTRRTGSAPRPGMLDGVSAHRHRPASSTGSGPSRRISVLGIDAPPTAEAPNALVPAAKAKVSACGSRPGDDPKTAYAALQRPPGAARAVGRAGRGRRWSTTASPCVIDATGPAFDAARAAFAAAWDGVDAGGHRRRRLDPVHRHVPGDVPAARRSWSPAWRTRDARAHGPNESLHLGEFARVCLAEALLLREGGRGRQGLTCRTRPRPRARLGGAGVSL